MIMKKIILFLALLVGTGVFAQKHKDEKNIYTDFLPYYNFGKGLGITAPDSIFQLNIRFRMKNRLEVTEDTYSAKVRRLRLRFDGYVGDPKFTYAIQLAFAPEDIGTTRDGENLNIIRDAIVFYKPNDQWSFGFGQTKLPGNRQRINSSGALNLTDRSINNQAYNIDRDFGLQAVYSKQKENAFGYNIKAALTTGEGRNSTTKTKGLAYTGRIEFYPLGKFKKGGEFFEGDLQREEKPKLYFGGTYHYNEKATLSRGQHGTKLLQQRDLQSFFLDFVCKYNGWSFTSAYMSRTADNPIVDAAKANFVQVGNGYDTQLSYVFPQKWEIIGRFSRNNSHSDLYAFVPKQNQFSLGITKYIWEHAFKMQFEISKNDYIQSPKKDDWYARFQIEIGI